MLSATTNKIKCFFFPELEPILTSLKELAFFIATTVPGLDSMVGNLGLSNIYLLSNKQDATAYRQPSLNQLAANKS